MYCKECGEVFTNENAAVCVKCGTTKGDGSNYCNECGEKVKNASAEVCLNCGVRLKSGVSSFTNPIKKLGKAPYGNNKVLAIILAIFFGGLGLHRFYLGYKEIGFIQLGIFIGGFLIFAPIAFVATGWAFVDLIQMILGNLVAVDGSKLV